MNGMALEGSSSDRLLRGGALVAVLGVALTLVGLGLTFYWPASASAETRRDADSRSLMQKE